ncbi:MAG: hypothetical protein JWN10_2521, partial [Solirubrobacterales bacterium]|nr:hypothetical protein [Solirubrobacterales bacterium]
MSPARSPADDSSHASVPTVAARRRLAAFAGGLVLAGAAYLLFIDTTSLPELYVGAGAAVLGAIAFEAAREQGAVEVAASPRTLARAWRAFARVPADLARVTLVVLEALARRRRPAGML